MSAERVVRTDKYYDGAPDLVFEVVSPNDRWREVEAKTREWLQAGVKAVVTIEPETRLVRIDRPNSTAIRVEDVLQLDDVLPGWQLPLSELFA